MGPSWRNTDSDCLPVIVSDFTSTVSVSFPGRQPHRLTHFIESLASDYGQAQQGEGRQHLRLRASRLAVTVHDHATTQDVDREAGVHIVMTGTMGQPTSNPRRPTRAS